MVRDLSTEVTPVTYLAEPSGNRGSLTLSILHGERGPKVERDALYNSVTMTVAAFEHLPLHARIKQPLATAMQAGIVRSVRHGTKEGMPALFVQVPHQEEESNAVGQLMQLHELWNNGTHSSRLTINLPAALTNHPKVIIQCPRPLFRTEAPPKQTLRVSDPEGYPWFLNSNGLELIRLLKESRHTGVIEIHEAQLGTTEIQVNPKDTSQPDHTLTNACLQAFSHFSLKLTFAS